MAGTTVRVIAVMAMALLMSPAWAQYPAKQIRLIAPPPAGTATDTVARFLANSVSSSIGQAVLMENRAGADGAIAGAEVAKALSDGYTVLFATNSPMAAVPALRKLPPYDPVQDFTPISLVGRYSSFLWVNAQVPVRALQELIDYARANPGKLNYATGNTGGHRRDGADALPRRQAEHRPRALQGRAGCNRQSGGQSGAGYVCDADHGQRLREGRQVAVLATTLPQRSPGVPKVPTMEEAGLPRFSISLWAAIYGPAGMAPAVVQRLSREINLALNRPEVREQLDVYSRTLRDAGVQPE